MKANLLINHLTRHPKYHYLLISRSFFHFYVALLTLALLLCFQKVFASEIPSESQLKASAIYQTSHFVHWPDRSPDEPIRFCIKGDKKVQHALETLLENKQNTSRQFLISNNLKQCNFIYFGEKTRFQILKSQTNSTVTISGKKDFLKIGGVVELTIAQGRAAIRICKTTLQEKHFTLDASLMRIADVKEAERCVR
ncbi:YfiR family protein [Vibrio vulnificus]|nr:YfiR family protein [Vibrio vulnificus]EKO5185771.1 YfiR family protein [Vibrio vulnificus]EKO5197065.1 YfiR family protein [Vibrio vulnificus]ELH7804116.1 YfiR family protein [Vibrio vulnificus]MCU8099532.1 YfiR family protein [Vibrio vulnificus]